MNPVDVILWALAGTVVVVFLVSLFFGAVFLKMALDGLREHNAGRK